MAKDVTKTNFLRKSLFPNIPPYINFISLGEAYEETVELDIPWNLWTPCTNPLLLHSTLRAGFVKRQVQSPLGWLINELRQTLFIFYRSPVSLMLIVLGQYGTLLTARQGTELFKLTFVKNISSQISHLLQDHQERQPFSQAAGGEWKIWRLVWYWSSGYHAGFNH